MGAMKPISRVKPGMTVRRLLKERLSETEQSTADLAEAAGVPPQYVSDLVSGRRQPPWPARTDVYEKMTRFLRLGRNDLAACATAERELAGHDGLAPDSEVQAQVLELCNSETANALRPRARDRHGEIPDLIGRVLSVVQSNALRSLDAQIPLRLAATRSGSTYAEMRMHVLEFLEATPGTLTLEHLADFVRPHVSHWDVDLDSGVLRVVLRPAISTERHVRRPMARSITARVAR